MDTLRALEAFVRIVELGSLTAAAERLELSRSALTKHLAALERHYGTRLLQRTTRTLSLTEAGRTLYEGIVPLLGDLDALEQRLQEGHERPRGRLRVSAPLTFGVRHLAPLVSSFLQEYPDVSIDLELSDRQVRLVEEGFDLAVRIGELSDSSLVAQPLGAVELFVCAAPAYLQLHGRPEHPSELRQHRCLLYSYASDGDDWEFQRGTERMQVKVGGPLRANNGSVLHRAALDGHGIIRQPDFLVGEDIASGRLARLFATWHTQAIAIHAVYPHRRLVPAKVRVFIAWLQRHLVTPGPGTRVP
ncbi:LysR family transcriptional regulator [Pseudomonas oryzihabitans]|uniref:LysR family transcriptional regulator n=1 Tax=Pseudomonas oryzihabitans TaxID=47885 RepID=UPI0028545364|nr:LysR family transcriptional regulator [Pseudomonas psychrotolerans]MDR6677776.1 DNA-binding transcriptional LysR family regulator [Pseudomonas psychrotolerans]